LNPDDGPESIELTYQPALVANQVRVHETFNPGALANVQLIDESGRVLRTIVVNDERRTAPVVVAVDFADTDRPVRSVVLVLDTRKVPGWNEIDAVELVGPSGRGWAVDARASSHYTFQEWHRHVSARLPIARHEQLPAGSEPAAALPSPLPWSAQSAVGPPDTWEHADRSTAWCPREKDGGAEWLELEYRPALPARQVRIHETFNPGAVTRVILTDESNAVLAEVPVPVQSRTGASFLDLSFPLTSRPVFTVRIELDTRRIPGWNQIDAVELVGPYVRGWAAAARASSSFGEARASPPILPEMIPPVK
jgi:hypothetical protein